MGAFSPVLTVLTFSPFLLLFNDFILQPLPPPHPYLGYDDLFKSLLWTPFSLYILSHIETLVHPIQTFNQRHVFTIISGMYIYGFGINHSHNAASNWYENKMNLRTPEVIHWFDEICGHYVIVGVYAVVQLYWICTGGEGKGMDSQASTPNSVSSSESFESPPTFQPSDYSYVRNLGILGGYLSALLIIESQGVEIMIPLDMTIIVMSLTSGPKELSTYCRANSILHLMVWAGWFWRFGGKFVEPSELKGKGWDPVDVFFGGMVSMREWVE